MQNAFSYTAKLAMATSRVSENYITAEKLSLSEPREDSESGSEDMDRCFL